MGNHEEHHARYRRAFMGAFSEKAVRDEASLVEKCVDLMMKKFRGITKGASTVVDIASWLNFVTLDTSADLSFDESFESTVKGEPHPWVEIACRFGKGVALVASINHYHPSKSCSNTPCRPNFTRK
jgi:cytochrome P450